MTGPTGPTGAGGPTGPTRAGGPAPVGRPDGAPDSGPAPGADPVGHSNPVGHSDPVVTVDPDRLVVRVTGRDGRPWFQLRPSCLVDTTTAVDETLGRPRITRGRAPEGGPIVRLESRSSVWQRRWTEVHLRPDGLSVRGGVVGRGRIREVHLLADRRPPVGFLPSGSGVRSALSPNPDHPNRTVKRSGESAIIGVTGAGAEPGVGRWLFTPAPWCLAVSREESPDPFTPGPGPWAYVGVSAPVERQNWTELHFDAGPDALALRLDHQGHTEVDGGYELPAVEIGFGGPAPYADPYAAVAAYCRRVGPAVPAGPGPAWWRQPVFCGWGAQVAAAEATGTSAAEQCTQANYDRFLGRLTAAGVQPGTVVVDDKWAVAHATGEPDRKKWPDLRGWIARQHAEGRRVLLWWKAWDPEGAPGAGCVRDADGEPVALDPDSPAGRAVLTRAVTGMLAADGLDADGLKIDFTASTPSGASLAAAGPHWGAALLHELLAVVARAARAARPDAMIITHTPNPAFADVADVLRLNDAVWLDAADPGVDVVHQMTHRARIAAAAWPGRDIDTDGWCMPDPASWRRYLDAQPELGIPALYYAGEFDGGHGPMSADDLNRVAAVWSRHRERHGLPTPGPGPGHPDGGRQ